MDPNLSAFLGGLFVALGAIALVLMLKVYGSAKPSPLTPKLMRWHKWAGRAFVLLYLVMVVVMIAKAADYAAFNALQSLHLSLAIALFPLLAIKIFIVRRLPKLQTMLPAMGITIFVITVVMVTLGLGPFLLNRAQAAGAADLQGKAPVDAGAVLVTRRCQKCHDLERIYDRKGRLSAALWEATLDRMIKLDPALADVRTPVLAYMRSELAAPETQAGLMLSGQALVEARCSTCHALDRVFGATKTEDGWRDTIRRYARLLPDTIHAQEVEPITQFLYAQRGAPADPQEQSRRVFERHCGACHNLSRALMAARDQDIGARRWGRTIRRMGRLAEERGVAGWTKEQREQIAAYLAGLYQGEGAGEGD